MAIKQTEALEKQLLEDIDASDCTYGEVFAVLRKIGEHYQKKGREYLNCAWISRIAQEA